MPNTGVTLNIKGLESVFRKYAEEFAAVNPAAKVILRGVDLVGIGIRPVLDHFIFRTLHPEERIREFLELGCVKDPFAKVLPGKRFRTEVCRLNGFPAVLVEDVRDREAQDWVKAFGDQAPYVMAVRVESVEDAALHLEKQGVGFLRPPAGKIGEQVRAIASLPVFRDGKALSVLVLVERHAGNPGYYAADFWTKA